MAGKNPLAQEVEMAKMGQSVPQVTPNEQVPLSVQPMV